MLIETGENSQLLKTQNEDLRERLGAAEAKSLRGQEAEHSLAAAQSQLRKWQNLCKKLLTPDEKMECNGVFSPNTLSQKISELQQSVLDAKVKYQEQQSKSR